MPRRAKGRWAQLVIVSLGLWAVIAAIGVTAIVRVVWPWSKRLAPELGSPSAPAVQRASRPQGSDLPRFKTEPRSGGTSLETAALPSAPSELAEAGPWAKAATLPPSSFESRDARAPTHGRSYSAYQRVDMGTPVRTMRDFDVDVWNALHGQHRRLSCLSHIEPVRRCVNELRSRQGYPFWPMRGIVEVRRVCFASRRSHGGRSRVDARPIVRRRRPPGSSLQNLPFWFFHSLCGGIPSIVSQCSAILPASTRKRS
jgi:hypothetical protein